MTLGEVDVHDGKCNQVHGPAGHVAHLAEPLAGVGHEVAQVGHGSQKVEHALAGLEAARVAALSLPGHAAAERLDPAEQRHGERHEDLAELLDGRLDQAQIPGNRLDHELGRDFLPEPDGCVPNGAELLEEPGEDLERIDNEDLQAGAQSLVVGHARLEHEVVGVLEHNVKYDGEQKHGENREGPLHEDGGGLDGDAAQRAGDAEHCVDGARRDLERQDGLGLLGRQGAAGKVKQREAEGVQRSLHDEYCGNYHGEQ